MSETGNGSASARSVGALIDGVNGARLGRCTTCLLPAIEELCKACTAGEPVDKLMAATRAPFAHSS